MQNDPTDRSLNGKEREQERIMVRRLEVQKKKAEKEIEQFNIQIEGINVEIDAKKLVIVDIVDRIEKGKKLIGGAKIKDVFPQPGPEENPEEKKPEGGGKDAGKV